jgi:hypothetical protein
LRAWEGIFRGALKFAEKSRPNRIRILSGRLDPEFYEGLNDDIVRLMDTGIEIQVIVLSEDFDPAGGNFARSIIEHENGYLYRPSQKIPLMKGFILIGHSAYRFRTEREGPRYIANFNNKIF